MRQVLGGAVLALLCAWPVSAQSYEDSFRLVTRDAFTLLQVEIGTQRFRLDEAADRKGVGGMTAIESMKISVSASDPAAWELEVRKQLPAKIAALAKKVSTATVIGAPAFPRSGTTDTLTVMDPARGIVLQTTHGQPGITGRRTLTLAMLVGR